MGPGVVLTLPFVDERKTVDLRVHCFDVPLQEMLTRDSLTVAVTAAVYYRMTDPVASLFAMRDPHKTTKNLTQTTLRNVVSCRSLTEIIGNTQQISYSTKQMLDQATVGWGVHVERVELKDIRLPTSLCRAMAREAEAHRVGEAKLTQANGEFQASRLLRDAADALSSSKGAIQLRFIETLTKISSKRNHTLVMPLPR